MSNRVTLQRTVFNNYGTEEKTFGFRLYDDFGQTYGNMMAEKDLELKDEAFFNKVCNENAGDNADVMIDWALEHGIYIDDNWYEGKELLEWRGGE